ncbi:hypothetical protein [Clostridium sp. LS]|nr:hypothetical protein [Clostridium sp. LS]
MYLVIITNNVVYGGSLNSSRAHPGKVFKPAILSNSASMLRS